MVLAAAVSNLQIEFIDGVKGQDVPDKAIPIDKGGKRIGNASIGSWRAHMNAVQEYDYFPTRSYPQLLP